MSNATFDFNAHATEYNAARRRLIPPFDSFYGAAVAASRLAGPTPKRILDLGAGTGVLSAMLRDAYPAAELVLIDGAAQMLEQARTALGTENTTYLEGDLKDQLPTGPWDVVASALAIHHLDDSDKQNLFRRVYAELRPGGVFVNAEQVTARSPLLAALYAQWHERAARTAGSDDAEWSGALNRMRHDKCSTVEEQLEWLLQAGFPHADCLLKDHRFAVLVAVR